MENKQTNKQTNKENTNWNYKPKNISAYIYIYLLLLLYYSFHLPLLLRSQPQRALRADLGKKLLAHHSSAPCQTKHAASCSCHLQAPRCLGRNSKYENWHVQRFCAPRGFCARLKGLFTSLKIRRWDTYTVYPWLQFTSLASSVISTSSSFRREWSATKATNCQQHILHPCMRWLLL